MRNRPIYLGFFDFYTNKKSTHHHTMRELAKNFFEYTKNSDFDYLEDDYLVNDHFYHRNYFYHPFAKQIRNESYKPTLKKFVAFYD